MTAAEAPEAIRRLPTRYTIQDLIVASGHRVTDRQVRHWVEKGWCIDVEHVEVGGRAGQRWLFGASGFAHVREMAWLHIELGIQPSMASEIASSLLLTGEYVSKHYTLYATRPVEQVEQAEQVTSS